MANNFLRFGVWNIEGLSGKLNDTDFISKIAKFDLISLVETWLPYDNTDINIPGFYSFSKCRKVLSRRSRRGSGGITILVKSCLKKGIKFLDKDSDEEFVWWKLDKSFFKMTHDIYICTVYIPPQNSSREIRIDTDHFERLQEKIYKFAGLGKVLLCGDFNARIGSLDDFIDDSFFENETEIPVTIGKRCSKDGHVNSYGKSLVDLCIGNSLFALNGRTKGDLIGQFTCHTYNGASVVDYVIASYDLQASIINFTVDNVNEFSHHSCLSFVLRVKFPKYSEANINMTPHLKSFLWNENLKDNLRNVINSDEARNKLDLGVHSKSTNLAVYAELGRTPLSLQISTTVAKFWLRINNPSFKDTLVGEAGKICMDLYLQPTSFTKYLLELCNIKMNSLKNFIIPQKELENFCHCLKNILKRKFGKTIFNKAEIKAN